MKIFCMSDIHGYFNEFQASLELVLDRLAEPDTKLILLGDYIHIGPQCRDVINRIIELQGLYGNDRVIALMGNHEESCLMGFSTLDDDDKKKAGDEKYLKWFKNLPLYHTEGNTIFVHAGIDEEAGDWWDTGTTQEVFTSKYPADLGEIPDIDKKVVAGHIGTASISGNPSFHDIYYDGASHYYIDGSVYDSGVIPVLMVDTDEDKYYRVTSEGDIQIKAYKQR